VSHWVIIPVVLPALLAPLIVLGMRRDLLLQRVASVTGVIGLGAVAAYLIWRASVLGPEPYLLGNWPAPFGIVLVNDRLSALMLGLTALLALIVLAHAIGSGWDRRGRHFHALFQFQLMGVNGAFLTGDAFNLFVFFEILLIASYGLMIHSGGRARLGAGVQYMAYNLVGSTLFLFALGTVYAVTGTLNMADLAERMANLPEGHAALARVACVLLFIVFAVKGALVPFQFWLPATYSMAPGPVAALFAIMTKVGAYAVLRFGTLIYPEQTAATAGIASGLVLPGAVLTLVIGMVGVLGARTLGRMAAFAAIGSMGTLFLAIAPFQVESTAAALFYLIHSTLAAAALFLVVDLVLRRRGSDDIDALHPPVAQGGLIAALYFAAAIAAAGMPPLSGFVGKLLILDALREDAMGMWLWAAILATSLVAILGLGRAGSAVFWKAHAGTATPAVHDPARPAEPLAFVAIGAALAIIVVLTIFAGPVTGWLGETAAELHDPGVYIRAVLGPTEG
jgi:multicomponent K+:H+ antiporter subunit D